MKIASLNNNLYNKNQQTPSFGMSTSKAGKAVMTLAEKTSTRGGAAKQAGPVVEFIAKGIGSVFNLKPFQKIAENVSKWPKPAARWADLASVAITGFYCLNTIKSEDIEDERKPSLVINQIAVTAVSSTMAAIIDAVSDKAISKVIDGACKVHKEELKGLSEKEGMALINKYTGVLNKAKSLSIFSFIVRFAVPVLMVPVVGHIVDYLKSKREEEEKEHNEALEAAKTNIQNHYEKDDDDIDDKQEQKVVSVQNFFMMKNEMQKNDD